MNDFFHEFMERIGEGRVGVLRANRRTTLLDSFRAGRRGGSPPERYSTVLREATRGWDPEAERAKREALPIWRRNDPGA